MRNRLASERSAGLALLDGTRFANRLALKPIAKRSSPMADPTRTEDVLGDASDLAAAARDRGMEHLEGAKGQLAEGAERVAAAVERTADQLEGEGDDAISGFGRSLAGLMRQLSGGLRERDIEQFAGELGELARRNPGVFLAGSVALGFGVARFFKARPPQRGARSDYGELDGRDRQNFYGGSSYGTGGRVDGGPLDAERENFDADESLDLSANPTGIDRREDDEPPRPATSETTLSSETSAWSETNAATDSTETSMGDVGQESAADRGQAKSRSGKSKAKPQRSATDAGGKES
jgi:hypothetical protein